MVQEENFGYSLSQPDLTNNDVVQALHKEISSSKKYTLFHFLEALVVPYFAEKCSGKFSEPWDSTIYSGMLLLEILAVGACLHSIYDWGRASRHIRELEQMIDGE